MKYFLLAILSLVGSVAFAQPERETDDQQARREEWFYSQRAYPFPQIPAGARLKAIQQIKQMDRLTRSRSQALSTASIANAIPAASMDSATWTLIGPKPTDLGSTYVTAGRVNAIAIDPRDNDTVYIGAAEGGVWKTTDGGVTWKPLTDDQASLATGSIALDPSNPDIVYVGTGEENFAQDSYYGAGILKSMDGGTTWTNIVGPFQRLKIGGLAIHPGNGQILLCTTDLGVYRSSDGAQSWTRTLSGTGAATVAATSVFFDPTDGNIAYAALGTPRGNSRNGVYRSTDGGQTWQPLQGSGANALPTTNIGRIELAIAPSTPTILYAQIASSGASSGPAFGALLGIFKSTDSGATWNKLNSVPSASWGTQLWYDNTLSVNPKNADIIYAGGFQIYRSLDGGATWTVPSTLGPNRVEIHVDEHFLAFTPDGTKLYIANDGGMYSTTNIMDPQVNWTELNDTLAITQFYPGMSVNPTNSDIALAGAQDNGTQRFGGGASWSNITCGDGGFTAIDSSAPAIAYGACQNIDIRRSVNVGTTANFGRTAYGIDQTDRTQFISPFVIDPSNPQTLYFGTSRLWQSKDAAGRWQPVSPDISKVGTIKAVSIAPSDSNTVYVGTSDSKIQVTNNAQDGNPVTWTVSGAGLPTRTLTQIAVDAFDPGTAYATFSGFAQGTPNTGHVFLTTNAGANWTDISGNMADVPVNDIVVDPDLPNTLYAGTDAGVLVTTDGGATWATLGSGLPKVVVSSLVLHRKSRLLRAATHGRSVWDILVPLPSASQQPILAKISPVTANVGGSSFVLTVTGTGFVPGSNIRWNGRNLPTSFINGSELTAQILATDIAAVGRAAIAVFAPGRGGSSNATSFTIGPAPIINPGGVVSAAPNPTGVSALTPGSIAALYGNNLAPGITSADLAPPLPSTLGGVTVSMSSVSSGVALFYVSPQQINFQVPWYNLNGPATVTVTVMQGLLPSTVMNVRLVPYSPAIFTANQNGTGQAEALINGSGGALAAPADAFPHSRPVKKGEFIEIYANGLGAVSRTPGPGAPAPSSPLATTTTTPIVTIGGVNAEVSFSGLAAGYVGLYQINVKVPDSAPSGSAINLALSIGGVTSNTATIAVE